MNDSYLHRYKNTHHIPTFIYMQFWFTQLLQGFSTTAPFHPISNISILDCICDVLLPLICTESLSGTGCTCFCVNTLPLNVLLVSLLAPSLILHPSSFASRPPVIL